MNQPKFKFGDLVYYKNNPFKVSQIKSYDNSFAYRDADNESWYDEKSISLYTEPKPKVKLYEYLICTYGVWITQPFESDEEVLSTYKKAKFQRIGREFEVDDE